MVSIKWILFGILVMIYVVFAYIHMVGLILVFVYILLMISHILYEINIHIIIRMLYWIYSVLIVLFLFSLQGYTYTFHVVIWLRFTSDFMLSAYDKSPEVKESFLEYLLIIYILIDCLYFLGRGKLL